MTYESWRISYQSSEQAARAAYAECARLCARLEAAEKERDDLLAKSAEMEKQEPAAFRWELKAGQYTYVDKPEHASKNDRIVPLYLAPGAQAQPTPSIPEGWLRAIDEALVVAHIGVANESDTYEQARVKLHNLIGFHVDVATDPAVNGGWKLVPIEPAPSVPKKIKRVESGFKGMFLREAQAYKQGWNECRAAMIAAAREAKP